LSSGAMSEHAHERRRHFRGKPRPGRVLPVRFQIGLGAWRDGATRNVGVGGAFIADAGDGVTIGEHIEIELSLPSCDHALALRGVVRRVHGGGDGVDPGIGVEFVEVEVDVLLELNDYFASLTGNEGE
jgi:PilZ domain